MDKCKYFYDSEIGGYKLVYPKEFDQYSIEELLPNTLENYNKYFGSVLRNSKTRFIQDNLYVFLDNELNDLIVKIEQHKFNKYKPITWIEELKPDNEK